MRSKCCEVFNIENKFCREGKLSDYEIENFVIDRSLCSILSFFNFQPLKRFDNRGHVRGSRDLYTYI